MIEPHQVTLQDLTEQELSFRMATARTRKNTGSKSLCVRCTPLCYTVEVHADTVSAPETLWVTTYLGDAIARYNDL